MKRFSRILTVFAVCGAIASTAAAEPRFSVLHKLQVHKLVLEETPVAHLALAAHFRGVGNEYFTEAERFAAAAIASRANANRSAITNAGARYDRLAADARAWGIRAYALAAYHVDRAAGVNAVLPRGGSELQSGRGAPEPTAQQLRQLSLTARTRRDHLVLVEYYTTVAQERSADERRHRNAAVGFRAGIHKGFNDFGAACERLARTARREARRAEESASLHEALANIG
jgi:hypothetical protein